MDKMQEALCNLINSNKACVSDRAQLKDFLYEYAPLSRLQRNLILYAYDEGVVSVLNGSSDVALNALRLIKTLKDDYGVHGNYAFWAVESWCIILGFCEVASALNDVRPVLLKHADGEARNIPPIQEYKIKPGVYCVGRDFPSGEITVEVAGETKYSPYYGVSINPNRISARNKFQNKIYLRLEDGQYLKIETIGDDPLNLIVRVIA